MLDRKWQVQFLGSMSSLSNWRFCSIEKFWQNPLFLLLNSIFDIFYEIFEKTSLFQNFNPFLKFCFTSKIIVNYPIHEFLRLKLIRKDKNSRWPFILAFSCLSSFILMASACLCGTPERSTSMRFLSRYWIFTLGLNTVYQVIETLINTLPGKIP